MNKKSKKIIKIIAAVLIVLNIVGLWCGMLFAYKSYFCQRFTSYEPKMLYVDDYQGLARTRYDFESNKGQRLAGYWYYAEADKAAVSGNKAIIVLAHGFGGGGHNSYMDLIDIFVQHGFYVFTYDATGNDESEGLGKKGVVGGLPQGVIDLNYAISFVENSGNFPSLPILLFGHSWGGYSVSAVLSYHPEVKAVAEVAGFNSSTGMFIAGGKSIAGPLVYCMVPFYAIYEAAKYGKYAFSSGVKGLAGTNARIMIFHSMDDTTVPPEYGCNIYLKKFADDPRFTFVINENQGHSDILRSQEGINYIDSFNRKFDEEISKLDYDYLAKENQDRFIKYKADYITKNLDRYSWSHSANEELLLQAIEMYDSVL